MIEDIENVARAIFSPKMVVDGEIQPEAFRLRSSISEDYLSVMRMSIPSWIEDVKRIPQRKNRKLYGFAEMNVGEVRHICLNNVSFDVQACPSESIPSHAGIFIAVNDEYLIGGQRLKKAEPDMEQDFLLLAIQRELVDIAQKGLYII
jgi:hypothetical protein